MAMYHYDKKKIHERYFTTYSSLQEFIKAFLCMTINDSAMAIKYKTYNFINTHLSNIYQYRCSITGYVLLDSSSDSEEDSMSIKKINKMDALNVFNKIIILKL